MVVQLILKWSVLTLWQCPIDMLLWLAISRNPGGNLIEKICAGPNTWCKNGIEGKFQVKWFDTRLVSAEWLQNFGAFSCLSARLFSWTTTGVKYCITNQTTHAWGPDALTVQIWKLQIEPITSHQKCSHIALLLQSLPFQWCFPATLTFTQRLSLGLYFQTDCSWKRSWSWSDSGTCISLESVTAESNPNFP